MKRIISILMACGMMACGQPPSGLVRPDPVDLNAYAERSLYLDCWVVSAPNDPDARWYAQIGATLYGCDFQD